MKGLKWKKKSNFSLKLKKKRSKKRKVMNMKKKIEVEELEEVKVMPVEVPGFQLNLELGRQDLNDNFRKIQDKINELSK